MVDRSVINGQALLGDGHISGAGVCAHGNEARLALLYGSGAMLPLHIPRQSFRGAAQMLSTLNVQAIAIVAEGYNSAYLALSALVERMPVCLVVRHQVSRSSATEVGLAEGVANGRFSVRSAQPFSRVQAVRSLTADIPSDVIAHLSRALQIAQWPAFCGHH